ncbi:MAG TPA: hypothetical protein VFD30_06895, partial [Terriglobia bacterium]|nr:hypothetical protein [Terriglobia bacterium]
RTLGVKILAKAGPTRSSAAARVYGPPQGCLAARTRKTDRYRWIRHAQSILNSPAEFNRVRKSW